MTTHTQESPDKDVTGIGKTRGSYAGIQLVPTVRWALTLGRRYPALFAVVVLLYTSSAFFDPSSITETDALLSVEIAGPLIAGFLAGTTALAIATILVDDAVRDHQLSGKEILYRSIRRIPVLVGVHLAFLILVISTVVAVFVIPFGMLALVILIPLFFYIGAGFSLILPAVVLTDSIRDGWAAFTSSRALVIVLFLVLGVAAAPHSFLFPTLSDPLLLVLLTLWSGLLSSLASFSFARVYLASRQSRGRSGYASD